MDGKTFDAWTRTRATTANRRALLGWSLTAGLAGAFSRFQSGGAQFGGGGSCIYEITLTSSINSGTNVSGTLTIDIGDGGAIDTGSLTLTGQAAASVVGQATGPAIDLLASLADGTTLALSGVASDAVATCSGALLGILANADNGQLGTWSAQPTGSAQATTPTPTPATASGSGGSQSSGGSGSNGNNGGGATDTCPSGQFACGPNCCPSGASCMDNAQGICGCPGGTIQCGSSCVPDCSGDEFLNLDTCQCEGNQEPACVDLGGGCGFGGQCCSGWCNGGTCDSCGMVVCNDMCVDTSSDNNNCGNCNKMCIGTNCQNGSCQ